MSVTHSTILPGKCWSECASNEFERLTCAQLPLASYLVVDLDLDLEVDLSYPSSGGTKGSSACTGASVNKMNR